MKSFNIGTGRPVSVLELVTTFEKVNHLKLNYKFAPRRAGDVTAIWADPPLRRKSLAGRPNDLSTRLLSLHGNGSVI